MRPNKLTKKESAAMVVEMDGGDTTESEVDAVPRSYAAVTARPGKNEQMAQGRNFKSKSES